MFRRTATNGLRAAATLATPAAPGAPAAVAGCADAGRAKPGARRRPFAGGAPNVRVHGVPTGQDGIRAAAPAPRTAGRTFDA
ncbi:MULTISPECIES: hypothetical protein [Streptomyces]|uniref:hypothetical protein n=1 Tax=Streptomyces TaxID=1883 RepID=UPI001180B974|nr:hypothetical protein [Streptomyces kasugaensis]